jgi:hypothetical protein
LDSTIDDDDDDDVIVVLGFTGSVDFLFVIILFDCDGDERLDDDDDLSLLDIVERMDEDLVTRDVIIGGAVLGSNDVFKDKEDDDDDEGGDGESFPILEHV